MARCFRLVLCAVAGAILNAAQIPAQGIPAENLAHAREIHATIQQITQQVRLWPEFRADTIPLLYSFPNRGELITSWRGALPDGFSAVVDQPGFGWRVTDTRAATNTSGRLGRRSIATMVIGEGGVAEYAAIGAHEAFHVFEHSLQSGTHYIGQSENSFLVGTYPVFDTINLAEVALEGRLLAAALRAPTTQQARVYARQFAAVRDARHRRLGPDFSEFENKAEINEGLAEYVQRQVSAAVVNESPIERLATELDQLTDNPELSFRLRFYRTGPGMAFLLDRLDGDTWKTKLQLERVFLSELLARASGARTEEERVRGIAMVEQRFAALNSKGAFSLEQLRRNRVAQADSLLARDGITVVLQSHGLNWCGFDPQNLLHAEPGLILHTRWVRACGSGSDLQFFTPVVDNRTTQEMRAVVGQLNELIITSGDKALDLTPGGPVEATAVKFESPRFSGQLAKARLLLDGRTLLIVPVR